MAVLKRIKASTLMETMTATVLIVVIFMVASLILNNLFENTTRYRTRDADYLLTKMEYQYSRGKLTLPLMEVQEDWQLTAEIIEVSGASYVEFQAKHQITGKTKIRKTIIRND